MFTLSFIIIVNIMAAKAQDDCQTDELTKVVRKIQEGNILGSHLKVFNRSVAFSYRSNLKF